MELPTMTTCEPPVPYQTRLHTVDFDGTYREVEFVKESLAPGATVPTWIVREWRDGKYRTSRVSTDFYCRSKSDAYARYIHDLESGLISITKQIRDLEGKQKETSRRLSIAQDLLRVIRIEEQEALS